MSRQASRNGAAATAILGAAVAWAFTPALIHWTIQDSSSFAFSATSQLTVTVCLLMFILSVSKRLHTNPPPTIGMLLFNKDFYLQTYNHEERVTVGRIDSPISLLRSPLLMMLGASLNLAFLAMASQLIPTAVAAAVYETWPVFVIYSLTRFNTIDQAYRSSAKAKAGPISVENVVLSLIATVGLLFMLLSQIQPDETQLNLTTADSLLGIIFALSSAYCASLNVTGSIVYGRVLYYTFVAAAEHPLHTRIEDRGSSERLKLLWFTLLAMIATKSLSIPLQFVGAILIDGVQLLSSAAMLGALLTGLAGALTVSLTRHANILGAGPGINALAYISPVLALVILGVSGIELRRFDLFVIGASLILAINVLIQLPKPDEREQADMLSETEGATSRIGFTVFIVSLWAFGTTLYLRDEILPSHWLVSSTGEYWGLLGLSATVFTLLLGFRITRLSERMKREDEIFLALFRDCQWIVDKGLLHSRFLRLLMRLDRARSRDLRRRYTLVDRWLQIARLRDAAKAHDSMLMGVQVRLDALAHSKQQGRDIVELLALNLFAIATIGLGLLARQTTLTSELDVAWSGFLAESFVLLFVSTVSFLLVNLFDFRREREIPLIELSRSTGLLKSDYALFFRNRERLQVHLIVATLVSITMAGLFIGLLYVKWLG